MIGHALKIDKQAVLLGQNSVRLGAAGTHLKLQRRLVSYIRTLPAKGSVHLTKGVPRIENHDLIR